jgi:phage terminase small subunit
VEEYSIEDAAGLALLTQACEALDRVRSTQVKIAADGECVKDRFGQSKQHPLLSIERDSRAAFLQAIKALGLDLEPVRDHPGRPSGR